MQTIICCVFMLIISVATDVGVSVYNDYEFYGQTDQPVAKPVPSSIFIFGYHSGDRLSMQIYLRNEAVNVTTDVFLNYTSGVHVQNQKLNMYFNDKREKYYLIRSILNYSKIFIELELSTATGVCTRKQIVEGKDMSGIRAETNDTTNNDICLKDQYCVIEVDLLNYIFEESMVQTVPSQNAVIMYVIPSVIVTCVIILVIYISVKKYSLRNAHPVETIELNTYCCANEVVYADLSLVHGDSQPPRRDEESPYAEIIGVLKPH